MSEAAAPTAPQLLLTHFAPRGSGLGIADLSTDPMGLFGTLGTDIHACSARGMKPLLYDTRHGHRGGSNTASPWHPSASDIGDLLPARGLIATKVGSCANELTATTLIIRLSADNGTIREHSARSCGLRIHLGKAAGSGAIRH